MIYNKKFELKNHGDSIFKRVKEFEGRSAAFDNLGVVVVGHDGKLIEYKAGNAELAQEAVHKFHLRNYISSTIGEKRPYFYFI